MTMDDLEAMLLSEITLSCLVSLKRQMWLTGIDLPLIIMCVSTVFAASLALRCVLIISCIC